jgi:hypothetical protein
MFTEQKKLQDLISLKTRFLTINKHAWKKLEGFASSNWTKYLCSCGAAANRHFVNRKESRRSSRNDHVEERIVSKQGCATQRLRLTLSGKVTN